MPEMTSELAAKIRELAARRRAAELGATCGPARRSERGMMSDEELDLWIAEKLEPCPTK